MSLALPYQLTKTLLCALLELQATAKVDPVHYTNATLNHKYGVLPEQVPASSPKLGYFGIGTKGFRNLDDGNLSAPYIPSSQNLDLYQPLPMRIVPVTNDLTPSERANYRMRVQKTVNGQDYWAYYLKKLTILDNQAKLLKNNLSSGEVEELTGFDPMFLNPTPTVTSAEDTEESTHKVSAAITAQLVITGQEVLEAINVLKGGNLLLANISEVGIYAGDETQTQMADGLGGFFTGTELTGVGLCYHYTFTGASFADPSRHETIALRINSASSFLV